MNLKQDFVGAVFAFTVAAFVTSAYAATETVDGITWTVTFDAQGGSLAEMTRSVTNGCAVGELPVAVRKGFSFDGWFTESEGGTQIFSDEAITGDTTLYAQWTVNVALGTWTLDFALAKEYADINASPMLVYWTNPGCSYCEKLETSVFESEEFAEWCQERQLVMVYSQGDATVKQFARNSSGHYPYVAVYWNKGNGEDPLLVKFSGRDGEMPWKAGTLVEQFIYSVDSALDEECLTTADASESSIELIATNACRVTFEWKCSCEPLRKGRMYDYLAFSIDGVQQEAICGEVDWTKRVYVIEGEGEHVLKWTYTKDESGAEGEDCGWIWLVSVAAPATLTFLPGGAESGEVPTPLSFYQDDGTVSLPPQGALAWPKHTFLGWSDGEKVFKSGADYPCDAEATTLVAAWSRNELSAPVIVAPESFYQGEPAPVSITAGHGTAIHYTLDGSEPTAESPRYTEPFVVNETTAIRAIAVRDDYFDSPVASFTTTKDGTSYADAVNCPFLDFTPDDGTGWRLVRDESPDGWALRSGAITHSQTSRVEAVVYGEGIVTFSCKVAGEVVKGDVYDGLAFMIDGVQQGDLIGNAGWTTNTFVVAGDGQHTLSWLYVKDESDDEPVAGDCAWIDEVSWASTRAVTVTLDANGGSLGEAAGTLRSRANEPVGELPAPVREGWTFLGWFTGIESGECVLAETVIPNDATLYAHWTRIFLTVTFNANGGTCGTESTSVAYGEAVGALPVPGRDDYVFIGWFTAAEGGERVTADNAIVESMTLYAQWRCLFEGAWTQDADGVWSSGETADNTEKPLTMTVAGAGTVTFRWKVSCEDYFVFKGQQIRQDGLSLLVDGVEKSFINGVTDWASVTVDVDGSGTHTLEWVYVKDESGSENDDCGLVDGVVWTPCGEDGVVVDMGGGKTLTIPTEWISEKTTRSATDVAANGRKVWECYVLGLDPEDATRDFKITSFPLKADGTPDLANLGIAPDQSKWNVEGALLVIKGKATLDGAEDWQTVTDENKAEMRFFRVEVKLP